LPPLRLAIKMMEHKYIEEGRAISKGLAAVGDGKKMVDDVAAAMEPMKSGEFSPKK